MNATQELPSVEDQREEARMWAQWFRDAGYEISFQYTGDPAPFNREWQVWTADGEGKRVGAIDIDGCGASWHGPDGLWLTVIGSKVEML
jgi:ribulose bisphosphate carboxylase small subunit